MVVDKVMADVCHSPLWSHVHPSDLLRTVDEFCLWLCSLDADSETRINMKGTDQEILSGKISEGSGMKNGRNSTRVPVSIKSPPENKFSSTPQRSTGNSADPTQPCCPHQGCAPSPTL